MVDLNTCPPTPPTAGESSNKIKNFMGRTPGIGILKSKFLTVLGNSNELLNGISNKLTLSISSSESEFCDDDEEVPDFDESIDYTKIDFESRRLKARRAHEEIISGRFRHPNLAPKPRLQETQSKNEPRRSSSAGAGASSSSSQTSSSTSCSRSLAMNVAERSSTTRSNSIESRHSGGYGRPGRAVPGARRSDLDLQRDLRRIKDVTIDSGGGGGCGGAPHIDVQPPSDKDQQNSSKSAVNPCRQSITEVAASISVNSIRLPARSRASNSSTLTSLRDDEVQISPSVESATDWRNFIRSESQNSVPSWASSISLDCRTGEEPVKEFMKHFTDVLFNNASAIGQDLKAEFGIMSRLDTGRRWFTRFLLEQNSKSKRVDELTFYSLVQFLAIVLFECDESGDFSPAAIVTNLCFAFYREIDVPGCDPYREYLFIVMRQQPIWNNLRFWNAAFFEVIQNEQQRRLVMKLKSFEKRRKKKELKEGRKPPAPVGNAASEVATNAVEDEAESSSSSSHHSNAIVVSTDARPKQLPSLAEDEQKEILKEAKAQETIIFRELGTFTCNMHALGVPRELCMEFLRKQSGVGVLPKDKLKLVKENVQRMYHETDQWGAKMT